MSCFVSWSDRSFRYGEFYPRRILIREVDGIVRDASLLIGAELFTGVWIGLEARRVRRRHRDAHAMALIKNQRCAPQVDVQFIDLARF